MQGTISVKGGASIVLSANVTGAPKPSVTWQQNEITLESSDTIAMERENDFCRITIKASEAKNSGQYKLLAENVVGTAEHTFDVTVKGMSITHLKFTFHLQISQVLHATCALPRPTKISSLLPGTYLSQTVVLQSPATWSRNVTQNAKHSPRPIPQNQMS